MYGNLLGLMKKEQITYAQIAKVLNCRYQTVSNIVNGQTKKGFYYEDARKIKNEFFPTYDMEYIFIREQEKQTYVR